MKTLHVEFRYRCEICKKLYPDEWHAKECCNPKFEKMLVYVCDVCKKESEIKQEVIQCCSELEPSKKIEVVE